MQDSVEKSLDEKSANAILSARAERLRQNIEQESADYQDVIIFELNQERYAVSLDELSEIKKVRRFTVLPRISSTIAGIVNVRGRIVSLYWLSEHGNDKNVEDMFALVGSDDTSHIAILADNIIGTEKITTDGVRAVPLSLQDRAYITGVGDDGLVHLSINKILNQKNLYQA